MCQSGEPHHWLIASPDGPRSDGTCKRCGEVRSFSNYGDDWITNREWAEGEAVTPWRATGISQRKDVLTEVVG